MLGGRMCRSVRRASDRSIEQWFWQARSPDGAEHPVLHCESLSARSSCHLRVLSSSSSWRLGKSPDLASLDPGYVHVVCASTRQSRYFHCKEQARNNGPLVSATTSLHRHPRMQERCPVAWPARAAGASSAFALVKRHGL